MNSINFRPFLDAVARGRLATLADSDLLALFILKKDEDAFTTIVSRYSPLVWRTIRLKTGDDTLAEDAFQATFIALSRKAHNIRRPERLAAWLHQTARRSVAYAYRKSNREVPAAEKPKASEDPLDQLTAREMLEIVDGEIQTLPENLRSALLLCAVEGLSHEAAAERLGTTPGILRGQLDRARAKLRKRLGARGVAIPLVFIGVAIPPPTKLIASIVDVSCRGGPVAPSVAGIAARLTASSIPNFLKMGVGLITVFGIGGILASYAGFLEPSARTTDATPQIPEIAIIAPIKDHVQRLSTVWTSELNSEEFGTFKFPSESRWIFDGRPDSFMYIAGVFEKKAENNPDRMNSMVGIMVYDSKTGKPTRVEILKDKKGKPLEFPHASSAQCRMSGEQSHCVYSAEWVLEQDDRQLTQVVYTFISNPDGSIDNPHVPTICHPRPVRDLPFVNQYRSFVEYNPIDGSHYALGQPYFRCSLQSWRIGRQRFDVPTLDIRYPVACGVAPNGKFLVKAEEDRLNFHQILKPQDREIKPGVFIASMPGVDRKSSDHPVEEMKLRNLAFNSDSTKVVLGGFPEAGKFGTSLEVLEVSADGKTISLKRLWALPANSNAVMRVAFDSKNNRVAAADTDGCICLYDASNGRLLARNENRGTNIKSLSFTKEGTQLLSVDDASVKMWNLAIKAEESPSAR